MKTIAENANDFAELKMSVFSAKNSVTVCNPVSPGLALTTETENNGKAS